MIQCQNETLQRPSLYPKASPDRRIKNIMSAILRYFLSFKILNFQPQTLLQGSI